MIDNVFTEQGVPVPWLWSHGGPPPLPLGRPEEENFLSSEEVYFSEANFITVCKYHPAYKLNTIMLCAQEPIQSLLFNYL